MLRKIATALLPLLVAGGPGPLFEPVVHGSAHAAPGPGPLRILWPAPVVAVDHRERDILIAEKATQTLYLFRFAADGGELVKQYPCTTGKKDGDKSAIGDERTAEGVYFFTSYMDGDALPPLYGAGAFPMDYPNYFDRRDGRRGSGIWLHGVESDDRVHIPRDTRGCVAVSNRDFYELSKRIAIGQTPILVVERLEWIPVEGARQRRDETLALLDSWRASWEGKQLDRYLSLYDPAFQGEGLDLRAWEKRKRHFARAYRDIRVSTAEVEGYREDANRLVLLFRQDYASDGHQDVGRKRLYLRRNGKEWRILGEEWEELPQTQNLALSRLTPTASPVLLAASAPPAPAAASPRPTPSRKRAAAPSAPPRGKPRAPATAAAPPRLSLHELTAEVVQGSLVASFFLQNELPDGDLAAGYLSLAVLDGEGRLLGTHPAQTPFREGSPLEYRRGEWFAVRRVRHSNAAIPLAHGTPARLLLFAYGRDGELLLREETSL